MGYPRRALLKVPAKFAAIKRVRTRISHNCGCKGGPVNIQPFMLCTDAFGFALASKTMRTLVLVASILTNYRFMRHVIDSISGWISWCFLYRAPSTNCSIMMLSYSFLSSGAFFSFLFTFIRRFLLCCSLVSVGLGQESSGVSRCFQ